MFCSSHGAFDSKRMREQQVFVNVAFDFEYVAEDGKKVFMKENEVLLLINKTNRDWWQVIRRGDRRPFYAPAKYVIELRPEELEAMRRRSSAAEVAAAAAAAATAASSQPSSSVNSANNNVAAAVRMRHKMSTFGRERNGQHIFNGNNGSTKEHLFLGSSRFQERYRSNSLDSILVSDHLKAGGHILPPKRSSAVEIKVLPPASATPREEDDASSKLGQQQFLKRQQLKNNLEKRPTFDSLDKRKSWSVDVSSARSGGAGQPKQHQSMERVGGGQLRNARGQTLQQVQQQQKKLLATSKGRISAYQNTQALFGSSTAASTLSLASKASTLESESKRRKPVPLPRSKIPLPAAALASGNSSQANSHNSVRKLSDQPRSLHSRFFSKRSKTDLGSDGLAAYKAGKKAASVKYPAPKAPKVPSFDRPVPQKRPEPPIAKVEENVVSVKKSSEKSVSPNNLKTTAATNNKPEIKEKPLFSTFKSQPSPSKEEESSENGDSSRLTKAVSESDLVTSFRTEAMNSHVIVEHVSAAEPVSINVGKEKENFNDSNMSNNRLVIDTSKDFCQPSVKPLEQFEVAAETLCEEDEEEEDGEEEEEQKSEYVLKLGQGSPDKSCSSTSFDSVESSDVNIPIKANREQEDDDVVELDEVRLERNKSPAAVSTTSRSPPSPGPAGLLPVRKHVVPDWDEYAEGSTGRKFYRNRVTKEKSWKPPRRVRGETSSSGPTSPVPDATDGGGTIEKEQKEEAEQKTVSDEKNKSEIVTSQIEIPDGYEVRQNEEAGGRPYYVNVFTGVRWFSAQDSSGKVYFYEENGNESCWRLPSVGQSIKDVGEDKTGAKEQKNQHESVERKRSASTSSSSIKRPLTSSTKRIAQNYASMQEEEPPNTVSSNSTGTTSSVTKTELLSSSAADRKLAKNQGVPPHFSLPVSSPNFTVGGVNIVVVKQGPLSRTKLVENGRRHRKNWSCSHAVLTDTFLLFFRDAKTFSILQSGASTGGGNNVKPEHCVDLKGATVSWCAAGDKSKRSNVFEVSTLLGLTMLMQDDSLQVSAEWYQEIRDVIEALEERGTVGRRGKRTVVDEDETVVSAAVVEDEAGLRKTSNTSQSSTLQHPSDKRKHPPSAAAAAAALSSKENRVSRTKSLKMKLLGSNEELLEHHQGDFPSGAPQSAPIIGEATNAMLLPGATSSGGTSKTNIREKLRKFFLRRPTMDDLFRRGIIRNEPVFGSTLRELQAADPSGADVPSFVRACIAEIERTPDHLRADGVYRQSGNLSHVQRIRLQVDQGNLAVLESVDDVHVLTGALKLFFRELREPLIPWDCVDKLLATCRSGGNSPSKVKRLRDIIAGMPQTHRATLAALLRHLTRVTELREFNRMQIPNLAIVFGPTLMWPPPGGALVSQNLALDMMQQNIIVETLLNNVQSLF